MGPTLRPNASTRLLTLGSAALLSAVVALLPAPVAHALSCPQMSLHSQYLWADVVAIGSVLSYDTEYVRYPATRDADAGHEAEVAIERYLKGRGPEVITVASYTWAMGRPWGEADVGERWLFFMRSEAESERYVAGACSGSGPLTVGNVTGMLVADLLSPLVLGLGVLGLLGAGGFWVWRTMGRWERERGDGSR